MVMRTMRENTKWIMLILTVAFVGWLVFDWVQGGGGTAQQSTNPVVGQVNGEQIRLAEWNRTLQSRFEQVRQQVEGALTDEQRHQVEQQTWDEMVTRRLIRQELDRLGLEATEAEIRQAFRTSPPPSLREHPAFQTDGRFDFEKYRQFFADPGVDENLLLQIESYYREVIPQDKLFRLVSQEVVVSEEDLWHWYRDRNSRARVRFLSLDPARAVADTAVTVTEEEIRSHYEENREEYSRPPTAVVDIVSLGAEPGAADSAAARARVDSLRGLVESGEREFPDLVRAASEGELGDVGGGEIGPVTLEDLIPPLADAVFSLPEGALSDPVASPSGFHLIRVLSREGEGSEERATFSHLLVPVRLSRAGEDELFDRLDELEEIALRTDLETAADSLGIPIRDDVRLEEGSGFVPGAGALGVAVNWALGPEAQIGDLSQFFENATGFHIVELEDRFPAGTRPLEEVRDEIRQRLLERKKRERTRELLARALERLSAGASLEEVASSLGTEVRDSGFFTRTRFVQGLGQETEAIGAAFGLAPGERAGPLDAGDRVALVELVDREEASREVFENRKDEIRARLTQERRGTYLQRWVDALRESSEVIDQRNEIGPGGTGSVAS